MPRARTSFIVLAITLCTACAGEPKKDDAKPAPAPAPASAPALQKYDLKGKVVAVDKAAKTLTVDHEAIEGFMAAMTMPYAVRDEKALETVEAGDQVTAKVVAGGSGYWLEQVTVTGKAPKN